MFSCLLSTFSHRMIEAADAFKNTHSTYLKSVENVQNSLNGLSCLIDGKTFSYSAMEGDGQSMPNNDDNRPPIVVVINNPKKAKRMSNYQKQLKQRTNGCWLTSKRRKIHKKRPKATKSVNSPVNNSEPLQETNMDAATTESGGGTEFEMGAMNVVTPATKNPMGPCPICKKVMKRSNIERHVAQLHGSPTLQYVSCPKCAILCRPSYFGQHFYTKHKNAKTVNCAICGLDIKPHQYFLHLHKFH